MKVGHWRFPEDVIDNKVFIHALIRLLLRTGKIQQIELDQAIREVQDEIMRMDSSIRFERTTAPLPPPVQAG